MSESLPLFFLTGEESESCLFLLSGGESESCLFCLGGEASESYRFGGGDESELNLFFLGGDTSESCLFLLGGEESESLSPLNCFLFGDLSAALALLTPPLTFGCCFLFWGSFASLPFFFTLVRGESEESEVDESESLLTFLLFDDLFRLAAALELNFLPLRERSESCLRGGEASKSCLLGGEASESYLFLLAGGDGEALESCLFGL